MEWVWELYKRYVYKQLARAGNKNPSDDEVQDVFMSIFSQTTITVLVQEPWQNSVRFKGLARYEAADATELIHDPTKFLFDQFGGGKFKLNFHQGWNFITTHNFKPEGEPRWKDLPDMEF